jgi:PTH1 family peptidyl-tRNA hydrolase
LADGIALIAGLGNPGPSYAQTRHNAGAWFVELLARQAHVHLALDPRFQAEVGRWSGDGQGCWLLKPITYMNRSGVAVAQFARFYKLASESILVAHDDLDLSPGTVRLKQGGGHGGHNGLRDVTTHLGDNGFFRLRLGIGHPGQRELVTPYVLSPPSPEQRELLLAAIAEAVEVVPLILQGNLQQAMQRLHRPKTDNRSQEAGG